MTTDRIHWLIKHMNYDVISDAQHDLVVSFEKQFHHKGSLSERQVEILESIFKQAEDKVNNMPWWEKQC